MRPFTETLRKVSLCIFLELLSPHLSLPPFSLSPPILSLPFFLSPSLSPLLSLSLSSPLSLVSAFPINGIEISYS